MSSRSNGSRTRTSPLEYQPTFTRVVLPPASVNSDFCSSRESALVCGPLVYVIELSLLLSAVPGGFVVFCRSELCSGDSY